MEDDPARRSSVEHAVDDDTMEVRCGGAPACMFHASICPASRDWPVGIQVIGAINDDVRLLRAAKWIAAHIGDAVGSA